MTVKGDPKDETNEVKPPPDGGYGWVVLIAALFISFIADGIMYAMGWILKYMQVDFATDDSTINLMSSLNTGFLFSSGPIVAGFCIQFGCRTVIFWGSLVSALMFIMTVYSPSVYLAIAAYGIVGGISYGMMYLASLIVIPEWFDQKKGIATGICMAGSGLGSVVLTPLIEYLNTHYDWRMTMSVCAALLLQCCVCGSLMMPLNSKPKSSTKNPKDPYANFNSQNLQVVQSYTGSVLSLSHIDHPNDRHPFLRMLIDVGYEIINVKLLWQNWKMLLIALSNFFVFVGYFAPMLYISKIMEKNNLGDSSKTMVIVGMINIVFRMFFGFIADRKIISPINLNTFCVGLCTLGFYLYAMVLQYTTMKTYIWVVIHSIGMAGMNSLTTMYLCDLVGVKCFANATGIVNLFRGIGCFIGPYIAGVIAGKNEQYTHVIYFAAICFSVGFALTFTISFSELFTKICIKGRSNENRADESIDIKILDAKNNASGVTDQLLTSRA